MSHAPRSVNSQGASVKIVVVFGQEADRRCSAGLERLDSALVGELLMRLSTVRVALVSVKMFCGA